MNKLSVSRSFLSLLLGCCLLAFSAAAQTTVKVSGVVKDRLDKAMSGVSVTVQGNAKLGTQTNDKGEFSITVSTTDALVFSYVGYQSVTRPVSNTIYFEVVLDAAQGSQEEVVVVGFGKAKKVSLVGAQSSVNVQDLKQPVANLSTVLAGRISGIVGVQRTGLPGENAGDLWIRGISTFGPNSTGALVIIDGVQGRDLNSLDPEDIASFTILKDASATAVYGVAGANGVILINTKRGKTAKPVLKFNYNQGVTAFTKLPELTGAASYMNLRNEARLASGLGAEYAQAYIDSTMAGNQPYLYPNVDWMKEIFKEAGGTRRFNFSASGGSENANYYVALAYYDEQSLLRNDGSQGYESNQRFKRYNFTSNISMNWTKTTKFDLGIQGYITNLNTPGVNAQAAFRDVMVTTPILYPKMYPGNLVPGINAANAQRNPYEEITQTGYVNTASNQVYSNARITQDLAAITPGLTVYGLFSFDAYNTQVISRTRQRNTYKIDPVNPYNADGSVNLLPVITNGSDNLNYGRANGGNRSYYLETALNYDRAFGKNHRVTGLMLFNQRSYIDAFAADLTASLPYRSMGLAGRGTYAYKEKYFAELNFGYNGSENFAPEKRFGFFPSIGVGWVLSKEKFFEPISNVFQFFKLRYSDGLVGSGAGGRRFGYLTIVSDASTVPGFNWGNGQSNQGSGGGVQVQDFGAAVQWSKSRKQDLGIEFKTFNSKLSVIVDFFKEHRTGVFLQRASLPSYVGLVNNPYGNLGVIDNAGFDATIETSQFHWGNTKWDFRGTITYNRDKIIENDQPVQPFPYMERRGFNSLSTYGYTAMGLFADQKEIDNAPDQTPLGGRPRPGDIRYKDLNSDGLINNLDISRIGNGDVPNLIYGLGANVEWKRFYIGVFFQGSDGAQRLLTGDGIIPFNNSTGPERSNLLTIAEDRWTEANPNPNAFYPRLAYGNAANRNNAVASSWWIKDISFVRLKTLAMGYNLPDKWVKRAGFKSAQVYAQGFNLIYWSPFKLWDPELNTGNGAIYPNIRTFSVGLEFTL
ncbi:MAG: TonB-dependent receptor [Bacteroidetes bacterium]|uniref:SusC/RagA family TonB-linked outer membrane protein n=1 Tax=Phnomibacter sp. TaxID=2836217 RepID=UPI002FDCFD25|nr:TonB-dependent receptor [Bacteroidota bacterium]